MPYSHALISVLVTTFSYGCSGLIDTHFHALPIAYKIALEAAGGDPSKYPTPDWTIDAAINSLDLTGSSFGIMSISTPGVPIAGTGQDARKLARTLNENLGNYSADPKYSSRVANFGVLPDWQDVDGTLAELDYLYTEQKVAFGVTVYTTYGDKLLSDSLFMPIWERLQSYKALVFLHPGLLDVTPRFLVHDALPQPIVDYPLVTTRTAVDLVLSGTVRAYPDVDIILSHAGGTIPFVGERAIGSTVIPSISGSIQVDAIQALEDFRRFYYDVALSTSTAQLHGLLDFAQPSHILYGSDFPYAPQPAIEAVLAEYVAFVATDPKGSVIAPPILTSNAADLLNKHSQGRIVS